MCVCMIFHSPEAAKIKPWLTCVKQTIKDPLFSNVLNYK